MQVAVVIFVKNEVKDIASWISWHFSLGVDKIFVYDDFSSDGTFEVVMNISKYYNVELFRTDIENEDNFYWRQRDSFMDGCRRSQNIFDWIGFLDADEYLYLENNDNIKDFLSRFENASAIALNWKIYGSSHQVINTRLPVYSSFNNHSTRDLADNQHIKSFIRPEKCSLNYINPHRFDMIDGPYVDVNGNDVCWLREGCKDIIWQDAWINHYICRSMEHFVNRIKRRFPVDMPNSTSSWTHFDRNEIFYIIDENKIKKSNHILLDIKQKCVSSYVENMKNLSINSDPKEYFSYSIDENKNEMYYLKNHEGNRLCVHNGMLSSSINKDENTIVILYKNIKKLFIFNCCERGYISNIPFVIKNKSGFKPVYKFSIEEDGDVIYLRNGRTYLSCLPKENGGVVEFNRHKKDIWEQFTLEPINNCNFYFNFYHGKPCDTKEFFKYIQINNISYNDFIMMISQLNEISLNEINLQPASKIIRWL